jgi:hypothetical protein
MAGQQADRRKGRKMAVFSGEEFVISIGLNLRPQPLAGSTRVSGSPASVTVVLPGVPDVPAVVSAVHATVDAVSAGSHDGCHDAEQSDTDQQI